MGEVIAGIKRVRMGGGSILILPGWNYPEDYEK